MRQEVQHIVLAVEDIISSLVFELHPSTRKVESEQLCIGPDPPEVFQRALLEETRHCSTITGTKCVYLVDRLKTAAKERDLRSSTITTEVERCTRGCRGGCAILHPCTSPSKAESDPTGVLELTSRYQNSQVLWLGCDSMALNQW